MTTRGLRDWVLFITILPTLLIALGLGSYFSYVRYQDLAKSLEIQASNIAEPLAVASEYNLLYGHKVNLQRLVNTSHRRNSPLVKSIAIFDAEHKLVVTSNEHREFHLMRQSADQAPLQQTQIDIFPDGLIIRVPVLVEAVTMQDLINQSDGPEVPLQQMLSQQGKLGYVVVQLQRDNVLLAQQTAFLYTLLAIFFGLGLAIFIASRLSRRLLTPLQQLCDYATHLQEGKLDSHCDHGYFGEIELLRQNMQLLAGALRRYRDDMQSQIDIATSDLTQTMEQLELQNVSLDLAKRRALEENKLKSEFLAKMSHELRTPLNGVIGFTRQLLKTQLTHHQQDYLNTIQKSANSLLNLVNDVLDYSKLEEGRMQINPEPFSLRDLVHDSVELLAANAYEKHLELVLHIDPSCPDDIVGDPMRINQVLMNIAGNAIKFTDQGSIVIRISATLQADEQLVLHFAIHDTGIGIAEEQQNLLFQGFAQADGQVPRRYGGTGLGLFISQRLVQAMGGSIDFESNAGGGSAFWFNVQCRRHAYSTSEALPINVLRDKTVLYIEHQAHSREATLGVLNSWQMKVSVCATPAQLQQALQQRNHYDIALIGHEVALDQLNPLQQLIRQVRTQVDAIYLLVNTLSPNLREALLNSGANACLSKPAHHRKLALNLARPYLMQTVASDTSHTTEANIPKAALRILTVDDNDANLKLINTLLAEFVNTIDSAQNGAEACDKAASHHYDLIFMDINMPVMDGIAACQQIKQNSLNETTPIIAVTAHTVTGERERLLALGFDEFLSKPLDEHMLVFTLREFCPGFSQLLSTEHKRQLNQLPQSRQVNWPEALQRAGGNLALAKDMLQIFLSAIPEQLSQLEQLISANEREQLLQLIHKMHGGTCYTGVPHIKQLTEVLETGLKQGRSIDELEPEFFELQDRLHALDLEAKHWTW